MHKEKEILYEQYINAGIQVIMYTILPLLAFMGWVIGVPILLYGGMMTSVDDAQGLFQTLVVFSLPMLLFFVIVPVMVQLKNKVSLEELGLKLKIDKKNIILITINLSVVGYMFYRIVILGKSWDSVIPVLLQLCAIGISEEVLCRGVVSYKINQIINSKLICVLISSLIFAFLFHSGDTDLANLLVRLPLGLILGAVRYYTGNVYNSIAMHIWYNAFMFIL